MADKYQNKYRIPSARLSSWDYSSNAACFITICTANREHYFGEIIDDKMQLSEIGKKANDNWLDISHHFSFVALDEFVIMPNHIHGIIVTDKQIDVGDNINNCGNSIASNSGTDVVETGHALSLRQPQRRRL